jgi:uncharacterized membrane protein
MVPTWTVPLSYAGYAAMLVVGLFCWLAVFFDYAVYTRIDQGLLDPGWRETGRVVYRMFWPAIWGSAACGGLAFLLALLPAGEGETLAQAHKAYQLRAGAILLCLFGLLLLVQGRMGAFDADIASMAVAGWGAWVVIAGWRAYAGDLAVAGPSGWWLVLVVDGLAIAALAAVWIALEINGPRMF